MKTSITSLPKVTHTQQNLYRQDPSGSSHNPTVNPSLSNLTVAVTPILITNTVSNQSKKNKYLWQKIKEIFSPVIKMQKDFTNTFKPYKSKHYLKKDLKQPIRGIKNTLEGICKLIVAPFFFIGGAVIAIYNYKNFLSDFNSIFKSTFHFVVNGTLKIICGVTQVALTPLTWFLKIPLRQLIMLIKDPPLIEESKGIQKLIKEIKDIDVFINNSLSKGSVPCEEMSKKLKSDKIKNVYKIHAKYSKKLEEGQRTQISDQEQKAYRDYLLHLNNEKFQTYLQKYIDLFDKDKKAIDQ